MTLIWGVALIGAMGPRAVAFASRADPCPRCRRRGAWTTIHRSLDDPPGGMPQVRLLRRCGACGAMVEEVGEAGGRRGVLGLSRRLVAALVR